jgi:hypothetical protein
MNSLQTAEKSFQHATRIQNSITSGPERRALLWLAARTPAAMNSDHLTLLGLAAMFLAGCSYAAAPWNPAGLLLATIFLAINWFGDSLDGTLARFKSPAPALRFLRRPHDRLVRRALPYGRSRRIRLRRLAHRRRNARRVPAALHRNLSRFLHPWRFPSVLRQIRPHRAPHSFVHRQYRFIFSSRRPPPRPPLPPARFRWNHRDRRHAGHGRIRRNRPYAPTLSRGNSLKNTRVNYPSRSTSSRSISTNCPPP